LIWPANDDLSQGGSGRAAPGIQAGLLMTWLRAITAQLTGGPELRIRTADAAGLQRGDSCRLGLDPEFIALWPAGDEFRARQPS
jgi:hypothetical protein